VGDGAERDEAGAIGSRYAGGVAAIVFVRGQRDVEIPQRCEVAADLLGEADDEVEPAIALEHLPGFAAADGDRDHLLHVGDVQAVSGDRGAVDLDIHHGQTLGLIDLEVGGAGDLGEGGGNRVGGLDQRVEVIAVDLDRDIA